MKNSRAIAIKQARELLAKKPVILDTETTGLDSDAEICEIALLSSDGTVLLDSRVRPGIPISRSASDVHGITDEDIASEPAFAEAVASAESVLEDPSVTIATYNAAFDLRLIDQSFGPRRDKPTYAKRPNTECVMEMYSLFHGSYNGQYNSFTWQSLGQAASQCNLEFTGRTHSALADARMTLALLRYMASRV